MVVVVGRDGQLQAFSRNGGNALLHRGIAVTAEGPDVNVRIATDPAFGGNLAIKR